MVRTKNKKWVRGVNVTVSPEAHKILTKRFGKGKLRQGIDTLVGIKPAVTA